MVHNLFNIMTNTTNAMNPAIRRVPYSKLLKREMADYAERTISIVNEYNDEGSLITPVFNQLLGKESYIEILRLDFGIDTERMTIYDLKSKLMLNISAFKLKVHLLSKDKKESEMHVLNNAINSHLRYLDKMKNDKELTQKVAGFFDLMENNEELIALVTELNLLEAVMVMSAALDSFVGSVEKRISLLAKRPNIKTQTINKGLSTSIDNLLKAVEVSYLLSLSEDGEVDPEAADTVDYEALMGELNELNKSYSRSINIRMHNNKRKAELKKLGMEAEEGADDVLEDDGANDGADDGIDMNAPTMRVTGFYYDDELDDELEGELSDELDDELDDDAADD